MHIHAWMHACTHEINVWHCSMGIPALVGPWQMRRGRGRGAPDYVWRMRTGNVPLGARPHGSLGERPAGHWTEVGLQFHARSQLEGTCGDRNRPIPQWFGWVLSWDPELAALMQLRSEPPLLWFVALQSPPDSAIAMATAHAYGGLVPPLLSHRDSQET
jgi:hypothetical protein